MDLFVVLVVPAYLMGVQRSRMRLKMKRQTAWKRLVYCSCKLAGKGLGGKFLTPVTIETLHAKTPLEHVAMDTYTYCSSSKCNSIGTYAAMETCSIGSSVIML